MAAHLAFARKYRPRTFGEVVGQEAIARALRGAVKNQRTASVYLFAGSHGVGKTSMARILAKALNCPQARDGEPCLECPTCESIDRGEALDVIEIDAASNRKIEDARAIRQNVRYKAQGARFKVYILDEAHQLTKEAFDALLKTFEEAPEHVRLILATTELHKVPSTIRSRAQVFHFRRSTAADLERRLRQILEAEEVELDDEALALIVRRARGSMRDAQKMLDQVVTLGAEGEGVIDAAAAAGLLGAFTGERVQKLLTAIGRGDAAALLEQVAEHFQAGGHAGTFLEELQDALRATLYLKTCGADSELVSESSYPPEHLAPLAEALSEEGLLYALQLLTEVEQKLRVARPREPRILLEVALVRLARAAELRPLGEVLARLERLEEALAGGSSPPGGSGGGRPPKAGAVDGGAGPSSTARPADRTVRGPRSASPPHGPGRAARPGYRYPAEMAPGAARAPATAGGAVAATASPPRDDAAPTPQPATAAPLDGARVQAAWRQVQPRLADPECLGMLADVLERGEPRIGYDPQRGKVVLRLAVANLYWGQLSDRRTQARLAQILGEALGLEGPAPLELERAERAPQAAASGSAAEDGVEQEPIVRFAARELDARRLNR